MTIYITYMYTCDYIFTVPTGDGFVWNEPSIIGINHWYLMVFGCIFLFQWPNNFLNMCFFPDGIASKHPNSDLSIYTLPTY